MKKFLSALLVALFFLNTSSLSALAVSTISTASADDFYVATKACPAGYTAYAADRIDDYINTIDTAKLPANGKIFVGTPFSFANADSDIFYFPVLCNGKIIYLFRVYPEIGGGYSGAFSRILVDELNTIAINSSATSPVSLVTEGDDIVAYIGNSRTVLFSYPDGTFSNQPSSSAEKLSSNLEVVSANEKNSIINFETSVISIKSHAELATSVTQNINGRALPTSVNLGTLSSIIETQGSEQWCSAYCTAWIVRHLLGGTTIAYNVMNYHYVYPAPTHTLSPEKIIQYAGSRGLNPVYVESALSPSSLMMEIAANKPVYLRMEDPVNGGGANDGRHGVVLRGYDSNKQSWSIWNPWYDEYDEFNWNSTYVPSYSSSWRFTYFGTIYDWE